MASYIDAANGVADALATLLAPDANGVIGLTGRAAKIYVGWPDKQTLQKDLKANVAHISVWPLAGERMVSVTMADMDWEEDSSEQGSRETQRRARPMQIGIWCGTLTDRDLIGDAIEAYLADTFRLSLADGSCAMLSWTGGHLIDDKQLLGLYRRDVLIMVTYSTLQVAAMTPISHTETNVTAGPLGANGPTLTINAP